MLEKAAANISVVAGVLSPERAKVGGSEMLSCQLPRGLVYVAAGLLALQPLHVLPALTCR